MNNLYQWIARHGAVLGVVFGGIGTLATVAALFSSDLGLSVKTSYINIDNSHTDASVSGITIDRSETIYFTKSVKPSIPNEKIGEDMGLPDDRGYATETSNPFDVAVPSEENKNNLEQPAKKNNNEDLGSEVSALKEPNPLEKSEGYKNDPLVKRGIIYGVHYTRIVKEQLGEIGVTSAVDGFLVEFLGCLRQSDEPVLCNVQITNDTVDLQYVGINEKHTGLRTEDLEIYKPSLLMKAGEFWTRPIFSGRTMLAPGKNTSYSISFDVPASKNKFDSVDIGLFIKYMPISQGLVVQFDLKKVHKTVSFHVGD